MVLALQTAYSLADFGGSLFIGKVVSLSLVRELAPSADGADGRRARRRRHRRGARHDEMTEQIDALRALARIPSASSSCRAFWHDDHDAAPHAAGLLHRHPGGLIIAVGSLHLSSNFYIRSVIETVKYNDLTSGVGRPSSSDSRRPHRLLQRPAHDRRRDGVAGFTTATSSRIDHVLILRLLSH